MTANKVYYPSLIGGKISGVQLAVQNTTGSSITAKSTNGIYYTFDGRDYQLLNLDSVSIPANETVIVTKEILNQPIPTSDIKIMIDTAGLAGCVVKVSIAWEV